MSDSDFHFRMTTGQHSNTVYEIQAIENTTSKVLFKISKASADAPYQMKNISGTPIFLKNEQVQKDEEKPVRLGDEIRFEIPQSDGQMKTIPFTFWPMEVQGTQEDHEETVQDDKKCSICLKYLHRCMTVTPCDHKFCSSCLSKYLEKNLKDVKCPKCRMDIQGLFKRITGHKLGDEMEDMSHPDLQFSEEEKKKRDQEDLIEKGAKLKIYEDKSVYFGFFKDGKREGKGKFVDSQQNEYDGEWKKDKKDGDGQFFYANGARYEGVWKNDRKNGFGDWTKANGDKYKGEFVDDMFDGEGKLFLKNGDKYEGKWKKDAFEGEGEFIWVNGNKYKGKFKDNKFEGYGEWIDVNGDVYKGHFKGNKRDGFGEYTEKDGTHYKGDYKDDKREGKGEITFAKGGKYLGDWKDGKIEGQGEFVYPNGDKYKGEWKDGMRNGHGKLVSKDGKKEVGKWKEDVFLGVAAEDMKKVKAAKGPDDGVKDVKDEKVKVEKTPKGTDDVKGGGQEKKGIWGKIFAR